MTVKIILNETQDGAIEFTPDTPLPADVLDILGEARNIATEEQQSRLDYLVQAVEKGDYRVLVNYEPVSLDDRVVVSGSMIGFNGKHKSGVRY